MSKSSHFVNELFFGKGDAKFFAAISGRRYEGLLLHQKLENVLFFQTLEVEVNPSYHFWILIENLFNNLPSCISQDMHYVEEYFLKQFSGSEVDFLTQLLFDTLICFQRFPIAFRDLYIFYPRFNLKFDELEFVYIDFGSQSTKVIASLLGELLVRDAPFRQTVVDPIFGKDKAFPPVEASTYSNEELHSHIIEYFLGEGTDPAFLELIILYLNSRSSIKTECASELRLKSLEVSDKSLAEYFLGYYIFKGVSNEALRFCVANTDLLIKDPFKERREFFKKEGEAFTEEERQEVISHRRLALQNQHLRNVREAAMTYEEKVAEAKALIEELDKKDISELVITLPVPGSSFGDKDPPKE